MDIETYYRGSHEYGLACIRTEAAISGERFHFTRIREIKNHRIYTSYGSFWTKSGQQWDHRLGGKDHQLVILTLAILQKLEARWAAIAARGAHLGAGGRPRRARRPPDRDAGATPPPAPSVEEAKTALQTAGARFQATDVSGNHPGAYVRVLAPGPGAPAASQLEFGARS
ncbi:hypothetical protein [Methylobacterium sp. OT2]|uniref:hypothetical protein n=1 Tax=Methylobacterium sp. OT2 TaxID=2813779 RepID=UPI00197B412B|nr:hypothetical protein [Methylobacterium sp. OT2]MBN4092709.1 hypothetical protein [Methylobacterium sp. OT2]